jgi:hypothetical protein
MELTEWHKEEARRDLCKFYGLGLYNTPSNPCLHDPYFKKQIERVYGMELNELEKMLNFPSQ